LKEPPDSNAARKVSPSAPADRCDLALLNAAHAVDHLTRAGRAIAPDLRVVPDDRGRELLATVEEAPAALGAKDIDVIGGLVYAI